MTRDQLLLLCKAKCVEHSGPIAIATRRYFRGMGEALTPPAERKPKPKRGSISNPSRREVRQCMRQKHSVRGI